MIHWVHTKILGQAYVIDDIKPIVPLVIRCLEA